MKHLNEGEIIFVQGSGKKPYEIKNSGGVISCSCPAWRNQSLGIDQRTCKHIVANVSNGASPSIQSGSVVNGTAKPSPAIPKNVPPCLLAQSWDGETDVSGWLCSNKLDGVRAWWDGARFWSRPGNEYFAPQWFKDKMPKGVCLDGELFGGNKQFQKTVSIVRKRNPVDSEWKQIKYMVFDAPKEQGDFNKRMIALWEMLVTSNDDDSIMNDPGTFVYLVQQSLVTSTDLVKKLFLYRAELKGYEGIMLRDPNSLYVDGRSHTLLKVKSFKDMEVVVIDYEKGKGKHKGRVGALNVRMENGTEFSVGTGLSDAEREKPPVIGSTITISYQELSDGGVPRFPSFVSVRDYE
jgi:DNA ligase-1